MKLIEADEGEYRIFAGAMEGANSDGFIAGVAVQLRGTAGRPSRDVFCDVSLACGHRWETQDSALAHAVTRGRDAIAREQRLSSEIEMDIPILSTESLARLRKNPG